MPEHPTPGQRAYAAFEAARPERRDVPAPGWDTVATSHQRAWEAVAQAVLAQGQATAMPPVVLEQVRALVAAAEGPGRHLDAAMQLGVVLDGLRRLSTLGTGLTIPAPPWHLEEDTPHA